jgi:CubicO group peptidase (beta-lactamase class C family)
MRELLFIVAVAFLLSSVSAFGQNGKITKDIDSYVRAFVDKGHFSGVVLAKKDGKVVYEKAFGFANADFKIPNQLDTRIGIASITKPMTSVILAKLLEERKVANEDKLSKYIPDFPNGDKITVAMIAGHRAGIPHRVMPPEMESVPQTSEEIVAKIKLAKLDFEPGARYSYSSGGYTVLARVLEIASGKTYQQLLEQYVFGPAGMKDSLSDPGEGIIERSAQDYLRDENGVYNAPLKDYAFLVGAGSVYSTAGDILKFAETLAAGGYGEGPKTTWSREGAFLASGSTNGHRAYYRIDPPKKYGYVLLSNLGTGAFDLIQAGIEAILDGRVPSAPVVPTPVFSKLSDEKLAEYLGNFKRDGTGSGFDMRIRNNVLLAGDIKLIPTKPDCFFDYKFYGNVCAVRDPSGKITSFTWASPGVSSTWVKQ